MANAKKGEEVMFFENSNTPWVKPSFCGTILAAALVAHLAYGAFDVRDFGAKGDGVAEDMVAVHGAIDAADVVSDTNRFSCGSGTVACLSPDSRRILAPYLASEAGRGECHRGLPCLGGHARVQSDKAARRQVHRADKTAVDRRGVPRIRHKLVLAAGAFQVLRRRDA